MKINVNLLLENYIETINSDWFVGKFGQNKDIEHMDILKALFEEKRGGDFAYWLFKTFKLSGICFLFEDGYITSEISYKEGVRDGICKTFYRKYLLAEECTYKNGVKDGIYKEYYKAGKIRRVREQRNYIKGLMEGKCEEFYENGRTQYLTTYVNNLKEGFQSYFSYGGKIYNRIEYKEGKKTGSEENFKNGVLYEKRTYDEKRNIITVICCGTQIIKNNC